MSALLVVSISTCEINKSFHPPKLTGPVGLGNKITISSSKEDAINFNPFSQNVDGFHRW